MIDFDIQQCCRCGGRLLINSDDYMGTCRGLVCIGCLTGDEQSLITEELERASAEANLSRALGSMIRVGDLVLPLDPPCPN